MSRLRALLDREARVVVMGILNRTPDSFSDGGELETDEATLARAREMIAGGAEILDVGAESTRPGALPVGDDEQRTRLGGSIRALSGLGALVSIDTSSPAVAEGALQDGAAIVNTVRLEPAEALAALCAERGASLVLMHSRGGMERLSGFSAYPDEAYGDVVADVCRELLEAAGRAERAGLSRADIALDPGLGFTKNARHSLALCARLGELCRLGYPVCVGPSRKSFLVAGLPEAERPRPAERLGATIAATLAGAAAGARLVRVHDVGPVAQALRTAERIASAGSASVTSVTSETAPEGATGRARRAS